MFISPQPAPKPKTNRLLSAIAPAEQARLAPLLEEVHLKPRQTLSAAGSRIDYAYFPVDCVTSTLMQLPEGDTVEVGLMGAEGVVGLALLYGEHTASTTVIVQVGGLALRMHADDFRREVFGRDGEFYRLLLRYANIFLAMVAQVAGCNANHSVEQRLSRWLLLTHDRVERDTFPLTHEFASLMLGVRRASVTQVANTLRNGGAIDYRAGEITITDRRALERASCGCYDAMRALSESIFDAYR